MEDYIEIKVRIAREKLRQPEVRRRVLGMIRDGHRGENLWGLRGHTSTGDDSLEIIPPDLAELEGVVITIE